MRHGLFAVMVLALAGCGGDGGGNGGGGAGGGGGGGEDVRPVTIQLEEMNNSGKTGVAELQAGAASTDVTIELMPPQGDNEPIHIHTGTCDSPGAEVAHDLGFTTAGLGQGQAFVPLPELTTGEYVLDIHSAQNPDEVIMCGAIPQQ
jgi:hypothetical protein